MATVESLITAEQFWILPHEGQLKELVRGKIVMMNMPGFRHGEVCVRVVHALLSYLDLHPIGRVVSNDAGVVTDRDPDTVRGADVAFYSFERLPKGESPEGYPDAVPELIFEVRSPSDRWPDLLTKVGDYLRGGVTAVCVVDPTTQSVAVHHADQPAETFGDDDELTLPHILPEFRVTVSRFFE